MMRSFVKNVLVHCWHLQQDGRFSPENTFRGKKIISHDCPWRYSDTVTKFCFNIFEMKLFQIRMLTYREKSKNKYWTKNLPKLSILWNAKSCTWRGISPGITTHWLGANGLESSFDEKDLGVPVDNKLNASQACVLMAKEDNSTLGCI